MCQRRQNSLMISLMEKHPNLYCDISASSGRRALERDRDFAKAFLTEYQDRVLFARDCIDNTHMELIESLGLDDAVKKKIYAENAQRLIAKN